MLLTAKPFINLLVIRIIIALITNKNNPNVTIVIGKVNKIKTGFTIKLRIESKIATYIAVT